MAASVSELLRWSLQASLWIYRNNVRRRMGLPETLESYQRVESMADAQLFEYLNDEEIYRYREYKHLYLMWDEDALDHSGSPGLSHMVDTAGNP